MKTSLVLIGLLLALALLLFAVPYAPEHDGLILPQDAEKPVSGLAAEFDAIVRGAGKTLSAPLPKLLQYPAGRDEIHATASALESSADIGLLIRIYKRNAREGHGRSARRLAEIYDRGLLGVPRDYSASLEWYERARQNGERIELCCRR